MTRTTASRAAPHDESGITLVMVLVAVVIIGVLFTAVLGYQSTALTAQTVLTNRRAKDFAADAAIDAGIMRMQKDATIGASSGTVCNTTSATALLTYDDPTAGDVAVTCKMTSATSGSGSMRQVELVATVGGMTIATADVTLYDAPAGSSPSVVSITNWERAE
jgi:Tfp pilus assembly protein PilV